MPATAAPRKKTRDPSMPRITFAARIREFMEAAGLSIRELAAKADIPYFTLTSYLWRRRDPSAAYLFKIAAALGVSADRFATCVSSRSGAGGKKAG